MTEDNSQAIEFINTTFEKAQQIEDQREAGKVLATIIPHLKVALQTESIDSRKLLCKMMDVFSDTADHDNVEKLLQKRIEDETDSRSLLNLYNTLAVHYMETDNGEAAADTFEKALPYISLLEKSREGRYDEYGMTVPTLGDFFIVAVSAFANSKKFDSIDVLMTVIQELQEIPEILNIQTCVATAYCDAEECMFSLTFLIL
jgi:hypothetical protein